MLLKEIKLATCTVLTFAQTTLVLSRNETQSCETKTTTQIHIKKLRINFVVTGVSRNRPTSQI